MKFVDIIINCKIRLKFQEKAKNMNSIKNPQN